MHKSKNINVKLCIDTKTRMWHIKKKAIPNTDHIICWFRTQSKF